jgi:hypothetical protein
MPPSDEHWALEIIDKARMAESENRLGTVWEDSKRDGHSSATVQNAMVVAAERGYASGQWDDAWAMISGLRGHVRQAFESPFANYVLSRIFEVMPTELVTILAEELRPCAVEAAKHRFGCRCMVRLIRHHAYGGDETVLAVIHDLVSELSALGRAQFGTHVVQELVDCGLPEHRRAVSKALKGGLHRESKNRFTGRIVEKALLNCDADDVNDMVDEFLNHKDGVRQLIDNEFGARVVRVLLGDGRHAHRVAAHILRCCSSQGHSRVGRLVIQEARSIAGAMHHE